MKKINLSWFNNILSMCKDLHWVTKSYAKHMALDAAYDDFKDSFDKFVEVSLGIFGKDSAFTTPIVNELLSDDVMIAYVSEEFIKFNNELLKITSEYGQLQRIFDDIKATENQLMDRLTLN